jgi:hypothetical protein
MADWRALEERVVETETGRLRLANPAPGVFLSEATGRLGLEAAYAYTTYADGVATQRDGGIGLHDWWWMAGYDPGVRQHVVGWSLRIISQWNQIHVALRSQVVKMGVTLANVALGGKVNVYTEYAKFEGAKRAALSERGEP